MPIESPMIEMPIESPMIGMRDESTMTEMFVETPMIDIPIRLMAWMPIGSLMIGIFVK